MSDSKVYDVLPHAAFPPPASTGSAVRIRREATHRPLLLPRRGGGGGGGGGVVAHRAHAGAGAGIMDTCGEVMERFGYLKEAQAFPRG